MYVYIVIRTIRKPVLLIALRKKKEERQEKKYTTIIYTRIHIKLHKRMLDRKSGDTERNIVENRESAIAV